MVGGEQSPGSLRQLHEKSSWEGQMHRWRQMGGGPPCSVPGPRELLPFLRWLQTPSLALTEQLGSASALSLPTAASYQ